MKRVLRLPSLLRLTLVFLIALVFQNCSEQKIKETTDETLNITQYLRANPEYSMFLELLDLTNYASFMNTYGTYTIFVPTNDAVQEFLNGVGATSLSQVPLVDLQNIAKLHILDQKVNTTSFTDGKIGTPSLYGQYLVTGAANKNGVSSVTVNKEASITTSNIELGNGVIHVIDKVLRVADKTLAQTIEADTNLSLFTEVLKATGWFNALNQPLTDTSNLDSYLTVLAQTNDVFHEAGFDNLEQLKNRYSHLNNPLDLKDSLNLFVSYRILPRLQYLADIAITPSLVTKAPLEVISAKLSKDTILLNEDVFNGVLEKGVAIDRPISDVTASNGVLHYVGGNIGIKKRLPAPVYFEFTDITEFRRLTAFWKKPGGAYEKLTIDNAGIDVSWDGKASDANAYIAYNKAADGTGITSGIAGAWGADVCEIYRFRDANAQNVTFKTPVIIKGRYKLWISYRANGDKVGNVKVFFNGIELPRQVNLREGGNTDTANTPETVLESQGYKRYTQPWSSRVNCRLVGVIDVETTGRHTLTLQSQGSFTNQSWFDIAEFRPIEMNQLWPKFAAGKSDLIPQP
ncbi:fasciclin domain-containing protein [Flavobacterium magnesitis]|uniref:fasciclin domain-containing protein n=1 Tax=Flavobacterium magnesitis TaxID=3138077 RepID=UPI00358FE6D5